ncbi:integrase core domain-containing protein [Garicola koreensis]|uniref:integrase core domain-containing protein n=1 Tax=Garicola koreensis TaxID=1262554 RepID=UPI0031EFF596
MNHAGREGNWSLRRAAAVLGLDHVRVIRWQHRAQTGQLDDAPPGPDEAAHALLTAEREATLDIAEGWAEIDRSHRKLAHRGFRLEAFYASESTVLRVLREAGLRLPGPAAREPLDPRTWPEWAELVPGVIMIYDFTHFPRAGRCVVAVIDVISKYWLSTVVSAEESSTQVEVAFTRALVTDGKEHLLDAELLQELATGTVPDNDERIPVLLAISDNGPQMTSKATASFMAGARIAQHFGRPGTPNDQAWVESFFGHLKAENPHLEKITDPGALESELDRLQVHYNTIRLHEGVGYVTPEDEHYGRGGAIRAARRAGLANARATRIATRRKTRKDQS